MKIIGLCGSSGSGKGYVGQQFTRYGVAHIDTDRVYRENCLTSPALINELVAYFGNTVLTDGRVDKRILASMVFEGENSRERLNKLNEITHKYIRIETDRLIKEYEEQGYQGVIVDAPVLFESGFDSMCHATVCVIAPLEEKLARIMARDNITREKAIARISSQLKDSELLEKCTFSIDNSCGADIDGQITYILNELQIKN